MSSPTGHTYSLGWLLDVLERRGGIDHTTRREVEIGGPAQRARIAKENEGLAAEGGGSSARGRYAVSPGELVASLQLTDVKGREIDDDYVAKVVAAEAGLRFHKIDPLKLDMALVTRTLSRPFALRHVVLPLSRDDSGLLVAVENPFDTELIENLQRICAGTIHKVVSSKRDILKCLIEIFGFRRSVESAARETQADGPADFEQLVELRHVGEIEASDKHIVNAVDFLFSYAFDQRASDIHLEPRRGDSQVRLRIDGVLHNTHRIPRRVHPAVTSRLKTLSRMDIAERRRPQDGRIKTVLAQKEVELRVSTMPVAFGEKVVIRIFDPDTLLQDIADLGFDPPDLAMFQRWIGNPHGLLLITGPTGSGKTTTLYTTLRTLADDTVNVTTVEDPIEMITDQFNQVAAQPKIGVDFASAMRTILRQDPDIIMVGEIRDAATAEMAVQAALTGHLVVSTLHTNDAVGAVARLRDLGVPNFLMGSTVIGVMAQRLVRRVCQACKTEAPLRPDQLLALGIAPADARHYQAAAYGHGCPKCRGTGFFGRIGIFEMLDFSQDLRDRVMGDADVDVIRSAAEKAGLRTLRQCALERLAQGATAFEEVVRVVGPAGPTR